jgi:hypothetical protein
MSRRTDARLDRLAKRADAMAARLDPMPLTMTIVVQEPNAEHPHGTRVRRGGGWEVYWDPKAGEPELPPRAPFTTVITLVEGGPDDHRPIPWDTELEEVDSDV